MVHSHVIYWLKLILVFFVLKLMDDRIRNGGQFDWTKIRLMPLQLVISRRSLFDRFHTCVAYSSINWERGILNTSTQNGYE